MAELVTTNGHVVLVDDNDLELIGPDGWFADQFGRTSYARKWLSDGRRVRMHTVITGWSMTDHINGNGLDNRRCNLRPATPAENARNRGMRSDNTSGFKGVTWDRKMRRWKVRLWIDGHNLTIGRGGYRDPIDAALAYDVAAREHYGQFARTNFPEGEN